ncbi:MAG: hypothetical protein K2J47_09695 [Ruminococcus sp.]|nr:hypothetical protein [Ruminococcus sp.]
MNHYKSWSGLNKQLSNFLCEALKDKITYFLTRYHDVHNAYGRAAVLIDKTELVDFSWIEGYEQEFAISRLHDNGIPWEERKEKLKTEWDKNCTYNEMDFLSAATAFLQMPISDALNSDNYIIRIFAILDKRVGKSTLQAIKSESSYKTLPEWVKQFYELRFSVSNC